MKYIIIIWLTISASLVSAHQDTSLKLDGSNIIGLPESYSPASFDVSSKTLVIGQKKIEFPICLSKYFLPRESHSVELLASWYHEPDIMPPYLHIGINLSNRDYAFQLLFNLETLEPISVEVHTSTNSGFYMHPIELSAECRESITQNIASTNA